MYGNMFDGLLWGLLIVGSIAGFILAALVFWLIPLLWQWLAPIIHAATA